MKAAGAQKLRPCRDAPLTARRHFQTITRSRPSQIKAAERRRADAPASRVIDRIGDRGRRGRTRRLAEPTPFRAAGRCEDRLDMRMLVDAEQVVGVEVGVDEATAFELKPASPGMGELPNDGPFRLLGGGTARLPLDALQRALGAAIEVKRLDGL